MTTPQIQTGKDLIREIYTPHLNHPEALTNSDLAEFAYIYYNIFGPTEAVKFITGWKSS